MLTDQDLLRFYNALIVRALDRNEPRARLEYLIAARNRVMDRLHLRDEPVLDEEAA